MIFITSKVEPVVQIADQTRLALSYVSTPDQADIDTIEIQPSAADIFYLVTKDYLDWIYSASGETVVTFRITSGADVTTSTTTIAVKTKEEDNLFSDDNDILGFEPDLYKYLRVGRSSWLDKHRAIQSVIIDELSARGYVKNDGSHYTTSDTFSDDFKKWSTFAVLEAIFEELSNATDDVFFAKSQRYSSSKTSAKDRSTISLDANGDGEITTDEVYSIFSSDMVRR